MMDYKEFYGLLLSNRMTSPIWEYILSLIEDEVKDRDGKEDILILASILFAFVDEGNTCMSLDKNKLLEKWNNKIAATKLLLMENDGYTEEPINKIKDVSKEVIERSLGLLDEAKYPEIIGKKRVFSIEDGWIYPKKFNDARKSIIASIDRLFSNSLTNPNIFDYRTCVKEKFELSKGQEKAVKEGINRNLIITGGPGTGKTTSILFLLMNLLSFSHDYIIYLVAPSGKASSRMKESIIKGLNSLSDTYLSNNEDVVNIIKNLDESTIHRLLGVDSETNGFSYNKNKKFAKNSIFVIDEASMIDICLFASLLEAIPDESRVFIMGDKNQLPSVDCGSVFADLLELPRLKDNIIELDESKRFGEDTYIYALASAINKGQTLPVKESDWNEYNAFKIEPDSKNCPVFYYKNSFEGKKQKDIISHIVNIWGNEYYKSLQESASELDPTDLKAIEALFKKSETARVLSAENEGNRGVKAINEYIVKHFIDKSQKTSVIGSFAGELMMINKNNKALDLYNGDSGILVTFKEDKVLYFMVQKATKLIQQDGKQDDRIFKLGNFVFYPLRLIARDEIDLSYAITIHKSQGSDYKNILVILPDKKGHPLLNRQIIYTAITRTTGNTYILSNQTMLEEAKNTILKRDTNIK